MKKKSSHSKRLVSQSVAAWTWTDTLAESCHYGRAIILILLIALISLVVFIGLGFHWLSSKF